MGNPITMNYYNDSTLRGYFHSRIILEQNVLTTISEYFPDFNELKKSPINNRNNNLPAVIEVEELSNQFTIYPNPTKGLVNVYATAENSVLTVHDFTGKKVLERKVGKGINLIDIQMLSNGIYQILIKSNTGQLLHTDKLTVL